MKIQFLGAAGGGVTGSCYVVEALGHRFAVDCGMHQGNAEIEKRNWDDEAYNAKTLDFVLLTHAHIDHSGLLPRLCKKGFRGPVYCTSATRDLLEIMLQDSAHIQEMEAQWQNTKRRRKGSGEPKVEPLYDQLDATQATKQFKPVEYNQIFNPVPGITVNFMDAGHILGSAFIEIWAEDNGSSSKVVFSGDLGRPNQLIVNDPSIVDNADFLLMESTYGDRDHKDEETSRDELAEAISWSYGHREKVIIPAFAVERTQELIYSLYLLYKDGRLPADMPVYVDSPLAIRATQVFRNHPEYFDPDMRKLLDAGDNPLDMPNLQMMPTLEDSMSLNTMRGPAVIISASGMANAGRVKHHLRHNLWKKGASVVFAGYQAKGTPGRKIVDGAPRINLLGDDVAVKARIFTIGGFSAHAGQSQILEWLKGFKNPNMEIILVHGEAQAQQALAKLIEERYHFKVRIPEYLEEYTLKTGRLLGATQQPEKAQPRIDWPYLVGETRAKVEELRSRLEQIESKPWIDQTEIRDRLLDLNSTILELLSDI